MQGYRGRIFGGNSLTGNEIYIIMFRKRKKSPYGVGVLHEEEYSGGFVVMRVDDGGR